MIEEIDLLPCPFCGRIPTVEMDRKLAWILCPEGSICRGAGIVQAFSIKRISQGVKVWNTRANLPHATPQRRNESQDRDYVKEINQISLVSVFVASLRRCVNLVLRRV